VGLDCQVARFVRKKPPGNWRFRPRTARKSGRGLPQSKTLRAQAPNRHFLVSSVSQPIALAAIVLWWPVCERALAGSAAPVRPAEATLFGDSFDNGEAGAWRFSDAAGRPISGSAWQVEREPDGNWVLSGAGHNWANLVERHAWGDFRLRLRVKLITGALHINYRINDRARYFVGFGPGGTTLAKQYFPDRFVPNLGRSSVTNAVGVWQAVEVAGRGGILQVLVEGGQRIACVDPPPVLTGSIAFETLDDSHVHVDEVTVIGAPPPKPPPPDPRLVWVRTGGPIGGIGYDVRIDPSNPAVLYVTDAFSGVSQSTNGGASWRQINQGIISRAGPSGDSMPVFCLAIDPRQPNVLWAGTQGMRGVYKSTDGGLNWVKSDQGIPDLPGITFRSFTIDPLDSNVVYAGTEIPTPHRGPDGQEEVGGKLYQTTDGGGSWREILSTGALVRWLAIDPTNTRILYAATGIFDRDEVRPEGVRKSTDGGKTWRNINRGLPNLTVGGLVMDPRHPKVLYAATGRHNGFGGGPQAAWGGVYKTTDGGESWSEVLRRPSDYFPVTAITLAPSNPDVVYVAPSVSEFYRSKDGGKTWRHFPMHPDGASVGIPIAVTASPVDADTVYLNSYIGGVFKSTDGGETWHIASAGYTGAQTSDVAIDPAHPELVYAVGRQGLARSATGGSRWTYPSQNEFIEAASLSVNPSDAQDVLLSLRFNGAIFRSRDGGRGWRRVLWAVPDSHYPHNLHGFVKFARSRSDPRVIYAAGRTAGLSAERPTLSIGVHKSVDGGERWAAVNAGLSADLNVNAVAVHPAEPNLAYAGTGGNGVYRTTDGGAQWQPVGLAQIDVRALAVNPVNPNLLYAGTERNGLFVSADGGRIWRQAEAGLEPNASIHSVVIDPADPQIVWAADYHSGVYRSVDGGKSWAPVNRGLSTRAVNALAIAAEGKVLYAATEGEGVFRLGQVAGAPRRGRGRTSCAGARGFPPFPHRGRGNRKSAAVGGLWAPGGRGERVGGQLGPEAPSASPSPLGRGSA
jgi:photosystem II stability/assembly factor-like uncharacterized protein